MPMGIPFFPRTTAPHIFSPAHQRRPCQANGAGLRQETDPEVHRGGQGHGEENGEEATPPKTQYQAGLAGQSWKKLPASHYSNSSPPTERVPGTTHTQLPCGSAFGGLQYATVEKQIGERGWEDGAGVPVGVEKEPLGKQRDVVTKQAEQEACRNSWWHRSIVWR